MNRILVTGASGFIGSALVPSLAAAGYRVRAAARRHTIPPPENIERVALPDITRPIDWSPLLEDIDVVVHLAGIAHRTVGSPAEYHQANFAAVADLAIACARRDVKRLIFMSSIGAQAGSAADEVLTEQSVARPVTAYDRAKLAAEDAVRGSGARFVVLRPVLVYGPDAKANVALLMRLAALPVPLPFGAFHNRRSLLALDNLISAVKFCIESPAVLGETFIVSDPEPIRLAEIFAVVQAAMRRRRNLVAVPPAIVKTWLTVAGRPLLWDRIGRDLVASSQKLRDKGWTPVMTTQEGLAAMVRVTHRPD